MLGIDRSSVLPVIEYARHIVHDNIPSSVQVSVKPGAVHLYVG